MRLFTNFSVAHIGGIFFFLWVLHHFADHWEFLTKFLEVKKVVESVTFSHKLHYMLRMPSSSPQRRHLIEGNYISCFIRSPLSPLFLPPFSLHFQRMCQSEPIHLSHHVPWYGDYLILYIINPHFSIPGAKWWWCFDRWGHVGCTPQSMQ